MKLCKHDLEEIRQLKALKKNIKKFFKKYWQIKEKVI